MKLKKAFISLLIMTLVVTNISLVNISSVQAATVETTSVQAATVETTSVQADSDKNTIKVSLDNIKEIMTENNLDMKSYDNTLQIAKKTYTVKNDALDSEIKDLTTDIDVGGKYAEAITKAQDAVNAASGDTDAAALTQAKADLKTAKADLESAKTTLDTDKYTRTTLKSTLKKANIAYEQSIESAVKQAQTDYINYLSLLSKEELAKSTLTSQEKEVQVSKIKYESGFISKNENTTVLQKNTDDTNDFNKAKDDEEIAKTKLYTTLGISSGKNITFDTDINEDFEVVSKINYNDDLEKMLGNNITIQIKNIDTDQLNDKIDNDDYDDDDDEDEENDINDYTKDNDEIAVKQAMTTAETEFKTQYNTLMNSYNSMMSSNDSLNQGKNTYSTKQISYDYGFASQKEVDDEKLNSLDTTSSTFQSDKNTFYANYLRYIQMKEGY